MNYADVEKLHELGLIDASQRQRIVETLNLREEPGRMLTIFSTLGALLIVAGIGLLISSNWDDIPSWLKISVGLGLMLSAWAFGYRLREGRDGIPGSWPRVGEALYLVGAGLWLGNIALVGQIYHLSSREPNALLLWLVGIASLPWILRSKGLFVLSLIALLVWLGAEANSADGLLGGEWRQSQLLLYHFVGLVLLAWGHGLRGGQWKVFSAASEKTGLLAFFLAAYPFCWGELGLNHLGSKPAMIATLGTLGVLALVLFAVSLRREDLGLTVQWRWTWVLSLVGVSLLIGITVAVQEPGPANRSWFFGSDLPNAWFHAAVCVALFLVSLVMAHVGLAIRSAFAVNFAITVIAMVFLALYLTLVGSMATTGWMFLFSGVSLIGFGVFLERRRRALIARLRGPAAPRSNANVA